MKITFSEIDKMMMAHNAHVVDDGLTLEQMDNVTDSNSSDSEENK